MSKQVAIIVDGDGEARCLYNERIPLRSMGKLTIRRASHVEPDEFGNWYTDLSPVSGPLLGPYANRSDALAAESHWLVDQRLTNQSPKASSRVVDWDELDENRNVSLYAPSRNIAEARDA